MGNLSKPNVLVTVHNDKLSDQDWKKVLTILDNYPIDSYKFPMKRKFKKRS